MSEEREALRRIAARSKGYGAKVAEARCKIKRRLRRAGIFPAWNAPTRELAASLARIQTCKHPPARYFTGWANVPNEAGDLEPRLWVVCCDCGELLRG